MSTSDNKDKPPCHTDTREAQPRKQQTEEAQFRVGTNFFLVVVVRKKKKSRAFKATSPTPRGQRVPTSSPRGRWDARVGGAAGSPPGRITGATEKEVRRPRPRGAQRARPPPAAPRLTCGHQPPPAAKQDGLKLSERKKKHFPDRLTVRLQCAL